MDIIKKIIDFLHVHVISKYTSPCCETTVELGIGSTEGSEADSRRNSVEAEKVVENERQISGEYKVGSAMVA